MLFDPQIGPYQVLPLRARVNLGLIAMNGYSAFSKAPALLKPHHQNVSLGKYYPSAEMESVYSATPANWNVTNVSFCWPANIRPVREHWKSLFMSSSLFL